MKEKIINLLQDHDRNGILLAHTLLKTLSVEKINEIFHQQNGGWNYTYVIGKFRYAAKWTVYNSNKDVTRWEGGIHTYVGNLLIYSYVNTVLYEREEDN